MPFPCLANVIKKKTFMSLLSSPDLSPDWLPALSVTMWPNCLKLRSDDLWSSYEEGLMWSSLSELRRNLTQTKKRWFWKTCSGEWGKNSLCSAYAENSSRLVKASQMASSQSCWEVAKSVLICQQVYLEKLKILYTVNLFDTFWLLHNPVWVFIVLMHLPAFSQEL